MTRPKLRLGKLRKTMDETMAAVREPGTRIPRLYRRWECVKGGHLMATTNLNIRIDENLKKDAENLFSDLGLNMSSAITIFLKSAVDYRGMTKKS